MNKSQWFHVVACKTTIIIPGLRVYIMFICDTIIIIIVTDNIIVWHFQFLPIRIIFEIVYIYIYNDIIIL